MKRCHTNRRRNGMAFAFSLCLASFFVSSAAGAKMSPQDGQPPAPIERRPPPAASPAPGYTGAQMSPNERRTPSPLPRGEHLAQWMSLHSNLTPEQQQQALGNEPGFDKLPAETQQRYRDRLAQLDALNPEKRQRFLAHTEAMERLSPDQRAEVRAAMGQLGALPTEERRVVARTFRALRDLPPEQRLSALNSGRFGPPMDGAQRAVILNLLRVEPMLPPPASTQVNPAVPAIPQGYPPQR